MRRGGSERATCRGHLRGFVLFHAYSDDLERAELTKLERADQIEEWRKLSAEQGAKVSHPNAQPHERGVSKVAEELGVTREEVQRAEKIASITPEAKDAAHEAGIDDNQSKLLMRNNANVAF